MAKHKSGADQLNVTLTGFRTKTKDGAVNRITDSWLKASSKKALEILNEQIDKAEMEAAAFTATDKTTIWNRMGGPYGKGLQIERGDTSVKINKQSFNLRWDSDYSKYLEFGAGDESIKSAPNPLLNHFNYVPDAISDTAKDFGGWFVVKLDNQSEGAVEAQLADHRATLSKGWAGYAPFWKTMLELRHPANGKKGTEFRALSTNAASRGLAEYIYDNEPRSRSNVKNWWRI